MAYAIFIGIGATAFMDIWSAFRAWLFGSPMPDYGLVGRWVAYLARGKFFHNPIARSAPIRGERLIGWAVHYATGIAFAAVLIAVWGEQWVERPALVPALIVGIGSVAAPFLLMQPGRAPASLRGGQPIRVRRVCAASPHTPFLPPDCMRPAGPQT